MRRRGPKKQNSNGKQSRNGNFHRNIIVIGASAGGVEALLQMANDFPAMDASIFVVVHLGRNGHSNLPALVVIHLHPKYISHAAAILCRQTVLKVKDAEEHEDLRGGRVYMAPPDRHLLVNGGVVTLSKTPAVNYSRPAIDTTFNSVVKAYGSKVIGAVLSGTGRDGSEGLRAIKEAGGFSIVEDPVTARFRAMPDAAVSASLVDCILPLKDIAPLLLKLSALAQGSTTK